MYFDREVENVEITYRKNLSKSYMCMEEQKPAVEPYELQMMGLCKVPGLIQMQAVQTDHSYRYLYDISGKQQIGDYLSGQKLGYGLLLKFLFSLQRICSILPEYLLREEGLCLELECVYVNLEDGNIQFTYLPFYAKSLPKAFQECMEQLLRKIDHQEPRASDLGYQVYQACIQDNISIASILEHALGKVPDGQGEGQEPAQRLTQQEKGEEIGNSSQGKASRRGSSCQEKGGLYKEPYGGLACILRSVEKYLPECIRGRYDIILKYQETRKKKTGKKSFLHRKAGNDRVQPSVPKKKQDCTSQEAVSPKGTFLQKEFCGNPTGPSSGQFQMAAPPTEILVPSETALLGRLVYQGTSHCEDIQVEGEIFVLGKNSTQVDGLIDGRGVSRLHARITCKDGQYFLEDLNSTNGTYLNDTALVYHQPQAVSRNDRIRFGMEEFVFL